MKHLPTIILVLLLGIAVLITLSTICERNPDPNSPRLIWCHIP